LPEADDGRVLAREIQRLSEVYRSRNADDDGFDFRALIRDLGIKPENHVCVNWHLFDEIDEFALDQFASHFDGIWYPSSDDIDVFDSSLSWLLSISHEGDVSFANLDN
jgi:hypothetical protein